MVYEEYIPGPTLAKYINCIWYYESIDAQNEIETVVPDGCIELIFHLGERMTRTAEGQSKLNPRSNIIGQMTRPYQIQSHGKTAMLGVRFYPQGAAHFLPFPIAQINDLVLPVSTIWPVYAEELEEQLNSLTNRAAQLHILEYFLLDKLQVRSPYQTSIPDAAIHQILKEKGGIKISSLANYLNISRRHLEKQFKNTVGIPPKKFAQIIQFQYTFQVLQQNPDLSLTQIAYANHYNDQSHFIRVCRQLTGVTPKHFFSQMAPISQHFRTVDNQAYQFGQA